MMPVQLLSLCKMKIEQAIRQIDTVPTPRAVIDIANICELFVTVPHNKFLKTVSMALCEASLRWLRSGLLDEIIMTRAEHTYHIALLVRLASAHEDYQNSDVEQLSYLCSAGACLRSEMPFLTLRTSVAQLKKSGVSSGLQLFFDPYESVAYDKRVLRCRSDEQDLRALCMILQLRELNEVDESWPPKVMPQVMLHAALKKNDVGTLAFLSLLGINILNIPDKLLSYARELITNDMEHRADLLPITDFYLDTSYAQTGLRVRNSLACCALFDGDFQYV